jgi:SAM-dependent methyltransferase
MNYTLLGKQLCESSELSVGSNKFCFRGGVLRQIDSSGESVQVKQTYTDYWHHSRQLWESEGYVHNDKQVEACLKGIEDYISQGSGPVSILDLGCASGLTSKFVLGLFSGVRHWAGVDFNPAILHAEENLTEFACSREYTVCDLIAHPYQDVVDLVICNAVLHHLPDPIEGLKAMHRALSKDGRAVGWVCGEVPSNRQANRQAIHDAIADLPFREALISLRGLSELGAALGEIEQKIIIRRDVDLTEIKAGTYSVQEFVNRYLIKCFYSENCSLDMADLYNYDEYKPQFQHRLTDCEWAKFAQQAGFSEVNVVRTTLSGYTLFLKK